MLDRLTLPEDIKKLSIDELLKLAQETRTRIIEVVSRNGGHLAASLGAVELTIALLYSFSPSIDIILYDVGHQAYAYKLLTDRRDNFDTLRQFGGISGFPNPTESVYDKFTAGHAGNALAAACGYARAEKLNGGTNNIVSVLGDGVLINGLTAESFNNVKGSGKQIIIINDNDFSISESVGSFSEYLGKLKYKITDGIITRNTPFALYDIAYIGGVDGHNIVEIIEAIDMAKKHSDSVIIHIHTTKGKGLSEAEANPKKYHAVGNGKKTSFANVLGTKLTSIAKANKKVIAVTAAMGIGTGLDIFQLNIPDRFFDVGIAEGHAVTMSAALARAGLKPYVAIYSTFLQRAYDQIINDVCLSDIPVTFCIDRSGIVGEDGATHHGIFDLNYLLSIPNLTIVSPADLAELEQILDWSLTFNKPLAIRYPRGEAIEKIANNSFAYPEWSFLINNDAPNVIIATGANMVKQALNAYKLLNKLGIKADVINARFIKPIDCKMLDKIKNKRIFTVEDGQLTGGFSDAIRTYYNGKTIYSKGINNCFVPHGDTQKLFEILELDSKSIANWMAGIINET